MKAMAGTLKRDPQLASLVRSRAQDLGMGQSSTLGRVISARSVQQATQQIRRDLHRGLSL